MKLTRRDGVTGIILLFMGFGYWYENWREPQLANIEHVHAIVVLESAIQGEVDVTQPRNRALLTVLYAVFVDEPPPFGPANVHPSRSCPEFFFLADGFMAEAISQFADGDSSWQAMIDGSCQPVYDLVRSNGPAFGFDDESAIERIRQEGRDLFHRELPQITERITVNEQAWLAMQDSISSGDL